MAASLLLLLALFGLIVVATVVVLAVRSVTSDPEPDASCDPFGYVGRQDLDRCAPPGETITVDGLALTAGPLRPATDAFERERLCAALEITNVSDASEGVSSLGWGLQRPDGQIDGGGLGIEIDASRLAAGASTSGRACFAPVDVGDEDLVLLFEPLGSEERAAWVGPAQG